MGVTKKLLIVAAALSLSACSMFEGKNTFMTYQDLQTKVREHDTELKAVQDELAQLKQENGMGHNNTNAGDTTPKADDGLGLSQSESMAAPGVAPAVTAVPDSNDQPAVQAAPMASSSVVTPVNKPAQAVNQPTQAVQKAPTKMSQPASQANQDGSSYGVQLAAYGSRQEAVKGWNLLNSQSPDVFVNLDPHVNQTQINGRTMYQLKIGPFLDRAYSVGFCNMLKQKGKDCIVKKFDGEPL